MASLVIPLEPVPASRPRVTKWGTYFAKPYAHWKATAGQLVPPGNLPQDKAAEYLVVNITASTRARTSKLTTPRFDVDNAAKASLDVVTKVGGYWVDDKQITHLIAHKRFAKADEQAHTEILIFEITR